MIQATNTRLRPFFAAASLPDWYPNLANLIETTPPNELQRVKEDAETELNHLGFCFPGGQQYLLKIYFSRIRQLCRQKLEWEHVTQV